MADVFISYSGQDQEKVDKMAAALEDAGYSAWFFGRDVLGGQEYLAQQTREIQAAGVFVFVMSAHTIGRPHQVSRELQVAHEMEKRLLPIKLGVEDEEWKGVEGWRSAIGTTVASDPSGVVRAVAGLLGPRSRAHAPATARPPMSGWLEVSEDFLAAIAAPSPAMLRSFFAGGSAGWGLAICPEVPRRSIVERVVGHLVEAAPGQATATVIVGAGGEGKSIALHQIAADLASRGAFRVIMRPTLAASFAHQTILDLPPSDPPWLLVYDDADLAVEEMHRVGEGLRGGARIDIHLLGAARDADFNRALRSWRYLVGGRPQRLGSDGFLFEAKPIATVDLDECRLIVDAWAAAGLQPERLTSRAAPERAIALLRACEGAGQRSLFGGILETLFDPPALVSHAEGLLLALRDRPAGDRLDLERALLWIAAAEVGGFGREPDCGAHPEVLADLMMCSTELVWADVLDTLGHETAIVRAGTIIKTRHARVAAAIVQAYAGLPGSDLGARLAEFVGQTVEIGARSGGLPYEFFNRTVACGPKLAERLPQSIPLEHRRRIAIQVAEVAERRRRVVGSLVDLAETLAKSDRIEDALDLYRSKWGTLETRDGYEDRGRGVLTGWATLYAHQERFFDNCWLDLVALSDALNPMRIRDRTSQRGELHTALVALNGVSTSLYRLRKRGLDRLRANGMHAAASLGSSVEGSNRFYFDLHARKAMELFDSFGEPIPPAPDIDSALAELQTLSAQVVNRVTDRFLISLAEAPLSFLALKAAFEAERG